MAYQELKKLLKEWEQYELLKNTLPSFFVRQERKSIARAIDLKVKEMKTKNEYVKNVSVSEKKLIEKIIDLLEKDNFD